VRTLYSLVLCPGCRNAFTASRRNQRHCPIGCRSRASKDRTWSRLASLAEQIYRASPPGTRANDLALLLVAEIGDLANRRRSPRSGRPPGGREP